MKLHAVFCAVLALSFTLAGPAFAQRDGDRQQQRNEQRGDDHERGRGHDQGRHLGWDQQQRRDQQARGRDERRDGYSAGQFRRGDRLPPEYRHRNYVVDDWRGHHLNAPPRGYHWVQVGGDYVLVAIATGVILQLFLSR
jgi:Ni/Co efflux regulator RcnB